MFNQAPSTKNYYKVLGLTPAASLDQIKQKYRTLALHYHPDRAIKNNLDIKQSEEEFKKLNEAYETLVDANKREAYDQSLKKPKVIPAETSFDFKTFYQDTSSDKKTNTESEKLMDEIDMLLKKVGLNNETNRTEIKYYANSINSLKVLALLMQQLILVKLATQDNLNALFKKLPLPTFESNPSYSDPRYIDPLHDTKLAHQVIVLMQSAKFEFTMNTLFGIWYNPAEILATLTQIQHNPVIFTQPYFDMITHADWNKWSIRELCLCIKSLDQLNLALPSNIHKIQILSQEDTKNSRSIMARRGYKIIETLEQLNTSKLADQTHFDRLHSLASQDEFDLGGLSAVFACFDKLTPEERNQNIDKILILFEEEKDSGVRYCRAHYLKAIAQLFYTLSHQDEKGLASQKNFNKLYNMVLNNKDKDIYKMSDFIHVFAHVPFLKITQIIFDAVYDCRDNARQLVHILDKIKSFDLNSDSNIYKLIQHGKHADAIFKQITTLTKLDQTSLNEIFSAYDMPVPSSTEVKHDRPACLIKSKPSEFIALADKPLRLGGKIEKLTIEQAEKRLGVKLDESIYNSLPDVKFDFKENIIGSLSSTELKKQVERLLEGSGPNVALCNMDHVGYGIFAIDSIPKDTALFLFAGTIIGDKTVKDINDYALGFFKANFSFSTLKGRGLASFMQHFPEKPRAKDAKTFAATLRMFGQELTEKDIRQNVELYDVEFASTSPSIQTENVRREYISLNGIPVIVIVTNQNIAAGEGIGFNYGYKWWKSRNLTPEYFDTDGNVISHHHYKRLPSL